MRLISQRSQLSRFLGSTAAGGTVYGFDLEGRADTITHRSSSNGNLATYDFTRDLAGQIVAMAELIGTTNYTYDSRGQVTSVSRPGPGDESFAFDATGNRTAGTTVG